MPRINYRFLLLVLLVGIGGGFGIVMLHRARLERNATTLGNLADKGIEEGATDTTIGLLNRYLLIRPDDVTRQTQLARLLADRALEGKLSRAEITRTKEMLAAAVARTPDDFDLREKLVMFLLDAGEKDLAISQLQTLREHAAGRNDPAAVGRLGLLYAEAALAAGKGVEAEEVLNELVTSPPGAKLPPGRGRAFEILAAIAAGPRKQPLTAETLLVRRTEFYPDDPQAWGSLANWYLSSGKLAEATAAVAKARALDEHDIDTALLDARIALNSREFERAAEILDGPLHDAPLSESLVSSRAQLAAIRGDVEGQIGILRAGLAAIPNNSQFTLALADALTQSGRTDDLRQLASDTKKTFAPDSVVARYVEARLAMAERRWQQAVELWNGLRTDSAANPSFARTIDSAVAFCQDALGRPDEAVMLRRRLASEDPRSPMAKLITATKLEADGRADEALAVVESLAATMPVETLVATPEIWTKLMSLRVAAELARPPEARDWSKVDSLLAELCEAPSIPAAGRDRLRVEVLQAKGDRNGAIAAGEAAVAASPGDASLLVVLARALMADSRGEEAAARIAAAPAELRDSPEVLEFEIDRASARGTLVSGGELEEIERRAATLSAPVSRRVNSRLFVLYATRGDREQAERIGAALLDTNPDDIEVRKLLLGLAAERYDAEKVGSEADEIAGRLGADSTEGRVALAMKGIVAIGARLKAAAELGTVPDSLDPDDRRALDAARAALEQVAAERPEWPDVYRALASASAVGADPDAEIGYLRQAVGLEPIPLARRRLAGALARNGRGLEALPVIASLGDAGGAEIARFRAELLLASGNPEDARTLADRITPADCRDPDRLEWYATILARLEASAEAKAACRRAIEVAPARGAPRLTLLQIEQRAGQSAAAEATRQAALATLTGGERDRFEEASAIILGRTDELTLRLRAATEAAPDDLGAARRLAAILLRTGRRADASTELRRIVGLEAARGTATLVWARRRLAEVLAASPSPSSLEESLALLAVNVDSDGKQDPDDRALAARILLNRTDPMSWRRGLGMMEQLGEQRPLKVPERVLSARRESTLAPRQRERIREELGSIVASGEGGIDLVAMLAAMCIDDGDTEGAGEWLAQLRELLPKAPSTLQLEARLAEKRGDHEAARRIVVELLARREDQAPDESTRLALALFADDLGFHDEADEVLLALSDDSTAAVLARAASLGKRGRSAEATALVEKVRGRVAPIQLTSTLVAILSSARDEDAVDGIVRLVESLSRESGDAPDFAIREGVVASLAGRTDRAKQIFTDLLAPGRLEGELKGLAQANLAFLLAKPATAEEASKLIDEAIAALGPQPDLLDTRAVIRHARGQTPLALADMADVILQPTAQHSLHLAVIRADAGDLAGARTAFEEALALGLDDERLIPDDLLRRIRLEAALGAASGGK